MFCKYKVKKPVADLKGPSNISFHREAHCVSYSNSTMQSIILCSRLGGELVDLIPNWNCEGESCDRFYLQLNSNLARQQ